MSVSPGGLQICESGDLPQGGFSISTFVNDWVMTHHRELCRHQGPEKYLGDQMKRAEPFPLLTDWSQVPLTTSHNKWAKLSVHQGNQMTQACKPGPPNLLLIKTKDREHWLKPDVLWAGAHCPNCIFPQLELHVFEMLGHKIQPWKYFEIMLFNYLILVMLLNRTLSYIHYYKNIMPESRVLEYPITIAFFHICILFILFNCLNIFSRFIVYDSEQPEPV